MEYANLKAILGSNGSDDAWKGVYGFQLISGEKIMLARECRRAAYANKYSTVWKTDDSTESIVVRSQIMNPSGVPSTVMMYYPASSILSVIKFLSDTQIKEDMIYNEFEAHDKYMTTGVKSDDSVAADEMPPRTLTVENDSSWDFEDPEIYRQKTKDIKDFERNGTIINTDDLKADAYINPTSAKAVQAELAGEEYTGENEPSSDEPKTVAWEDEDPKYSSR